MSRVCVGLRIDGDSAHAKTLAGADHASRDFAAIGNQNRFQHQGRFIAYMTCARTGWAGGSDGGSKSREGSRSKPSRCMTACDLRLVRPVKVKISLRSATLANAHGSTARMAVVTRPFPWA